MGPHITVTIWDASAAAFTAVVPQGTYKPLDTSAWMTLYHALATLYSNLQQYSQYDQSFMAAANTVSVSGMTSAYANQPAVLSDLQASGSSQLTARDLQARLTFLDEYSTTSNRAYCNW